MTVAPPSLTFRPMRSADRAWAADLMAASEPWLTLGRGRADALQLLGQRRKRTIIIRAAGQRAGFLVLDVDGPLGGYIQTIGIAPALRGQGIGTAALRWAEEHLFATRPNVFLCVSSFNRRARRLYQRHGYTLVGRLHDFIVVGHDELLLRKTRGPVATTKRAKPSS